MVSIFSLLVRITYNNFNKYFIDMICDINYMCKICENYIYFE